MQMRSEMLPNDRTVFNSGVLAGNMDPASRKAI